MRISDWSSDVCSSDLLVETLADDRRGEFQEAALHRVLRQAGADAAGDGLELADRSLVATAVPADHDTDLLHHLLLKRLLCALLSGPCQVRDASCDRQDTVEIEVRLQMGRQGVERSEEHTSELQSLMRISYAVFCLKKKKYT